MTTLRVPSHADGWRQGGGVVRVPPENVVDSTCVEGRLPSPYFSVPGFEALASKHRRFVTQKFNRASSRWETAHRLSGLCYLSAFEVRFRHQVVLTLGFFPRASVLLSFAGTNAHMLRSAELDCHHASRGVSHLFETASLANNRQSALRGFETTLSVVQSGFNAWALRTVVGIGYLSSEERPDPHRLAYAQLSRLLAGQHHVLVGGRNRSLTPRRLAGAANHLAVITNCAAATRLRLANTHPANVAQKTALEAKLNKLVVEVQARQEALEAVKALPPPPTVAPGVKPISDSERKLLYERHRVSLALSGVGAATAYSAWFMTAIAGTNPYAVLTGIGFSAIAQAITGSLVGIAGGSFVTAGVLAAI